MNGQARRLNTDEDFNALPSDFNSLRDHLIVITVQNRAPEEVKQIPGPNHRVGEAAAITVNVSVDQNRRKLQLSSQSTYDQFYQKIVKKFSLEPESPLYITYADSHDLITVEDQEDLDILLGMIFKLSNEAAENSLITCFTSEEKLKEK